MSEMVKTGSKYTDEDRRRAAVEYLIIGNMQKVSDSTGIPRKTLSDWKQSEWWEGLVADLRREKGEELDANLTKLIDSAFDQAQDRVDNGDYRVNKEGKLFRVPMGGRDLVIAGATVYDKQRLHRNEPTSIKGDTQSMAELADVFRKISRENTIRKINSIDGECEAVE